MHDGWFVYEPQLAEVQASTSLKALEHLLEAQGLIHAMLRAKAGQRLGFRTILEQPLWQNSPSGEVALVESGLSVMQARSNWKALDHLPEAQGLIRATLRAEPGQRPSIRAVMEQPFWWSPAQRLAFIIHLSDRVELCDREVIALSHL